MNFHYHWDLNLISSGPNMDTTILTSYLLPFLRDFISQKTEHEKLKN